MIQQVQSTTQKHQTPWVTLFLILINMATATLAMLNPGVLDQFAFTPLRPTPVTIVSSIFLHNNVIHLLGNLVFLAAVGPMVEFASGKRKYLIVYLLSGVIGVLSHWLMASLSGNDGLLMGASGSIAGSVAYCTIRYMRTKVPILPSIGVPVAIVALVWLAIQVLGAFWNLGDSLGGTSFWAHIGGFLAGTILSLVFGASKDAKIAYGHEVLEQMNSRNPSATVIAADQHLKEHPEDTIAWIHKAEAYEKLGQASEAGTAYAKAFETGTKEQKIEIAKALTTLGQWVAFPETNRMKIADQWRENHPELSKEIYLTLAQDKKSTRQPDALLALAEIATTSEEASNYLNQLQENHPFHGATQTAKNKGLLQ